MLAWQPCMEDHFFVAGLEHAKRRLKLDFPLKPKQREAARHLFNGRDAFICLPTGYGKSICYQCLPFLLDWKRTTGGKVDCSPSVVLVISPLLSLISDQVKSLRDKGIKAAVLATDRERFGDCVIAEEELSVCSLLYSSLEAILSDKWRGIFSSKSFSSRLVAVAIDEAHCVSKW